MGMQKETSAPAAPGKNTRALVEASLGARYRRERRFRRFGLLAVGLSVAFVVFFFASIISQGYPVFSHSYVQLDIQFDAEVLDPDGQADPDALARADYGRLVKDALSRLFPDVSGRKSKRLLKRIVSVGATYELRDRVVQNPELIGTAQSLWFPAAAETDALFKSDLLRQSAESVDSAEAGTSKKSRYTDEQLAWGRQLLAEGRVEQRFNRLFFSAGDSRNPELAGIWAAAKG